MLWIESSVLTVYPLLSDATLFEKFAKRKTSGDDCGLKTYHKNCSWIGEIKDWFVWPIWE